jgi:serine/threonine protein kinase
LAANEIVGGRYKVLSILGKGGMGLVYRVEQIFLGKELALKTIHKSFLSEITVKRFEHEARAAFAVNHPNIIAVTAYGLLDDQTPFLAMEIVDGETLAELLHDSGPLPTAAALPIIIQVCFGLAHAHNSGVVHRDIKPSNIMILKGRELGTEGSVKILDFGIAEFSHRDGGEIQALTKTGEIFGSPLYMSPEQCMGSQVDYRSDIYSLGCVIFETLTGKPPFTSNNALATLMMHQSDPPPTLAQGAGGKQFPEELESIVAKMLEKEPEDRYDSLGIVAHDLASILKSKDPSKISRPLSLSTSDQSKDKDNDSKSNLQKYIIAATIAASTLIMATIGVLQYCSHHQEKLATASTNERRQEKEAEKEAEAKPLQSKDPEKFSALIALEPEEHLRNQIKAIRAKSENYLLLQVSDVTAKSLEAIAREKEIETVDFSGSDISNENLGRLSKLSLKSIVLTNSNFNDIGAENLTSIQSLVTIEANQTEITDQGLSSLKKLKRLKHLKIDGTKVTFDGLRNICQRKLLNDLSLVECPKITEKEEKLLEQEFPAIRFDFKHRSQMIP